MRAKIVIISKLSRLFYVILFKKNESDLLNHRRLLMIFKQEIPEKNSLSRDFI